MQKVNEQMQPTTAVRIEPGDRVPGSQNPGVPAPISILGVPVHPVAATDVGGVVERFLSDGKCHHIVPVNPELVMAARRNADFRRALGRAALVLPDGIGIVIASRLKGSRLRERVTGVETTRALAGLAARRGYSIFLLGAAPGVADLAARRLELEHPGLRIAGTYAGSPAPDEEDEIISLIRRVSPAMLFVAYGAPKQELWVDRNLDKLGVPVVMSVGGTFDFLSGIVRRAPRAVQKAGFEWLYRLSLEPRRWRRMLALPRFAAVVMFDAFGLQR